MRAEAVKWYSCQDLAIRNAQMLVNIFSSILLTSAAICMLRLQFFLTTSLIIYIINIMIKNLEMEKLHLSFLVFTHIH